MQTDKFDFFILTYLLSTLFLLPLIVYIGIYHYVNIWIIVLYVLGFSSLAFFINYNNLP